MHACMRTCSAASERVPVQEAGERDGGRLLLRRAGIPGKHRQPSRLSRDGGERGEAPGAEHVGGLHVPRGLRAVGREPAAHPPASHRDRLRARGLPRCRLRHHRRQALRPHRLQGRTLRLPPWPRPLPEEQRRCAGRRHLGLQQPASGHAAPRPSDVRSLTTGSYRRAGQGAPDRRRPGGGHQVQVPAKVTSMHACWLGQLYVRMCCQ
uniref:Uncharacterized protein n=1 Tax=Aegilops tauschii subsp. strangulata TaxID=200361 RepID=A0A453GN49_AEGTS